MKPETFFDNFDVLAEAPNGVQKLRELIMQLAVRGKLVAQDEKDEPASVLLKNIKANQIKTSYNPVEEYEMPYALPKKWEWVRLGEILALEYGDSLPSSKRSENGKYPVYGSNGVVGYHDKFLIDKSAIIVGRKGSCGALNICLEPSWPTDVSYFIIPPAEIDLKFAYILLKSLNLEKLGKGIKPGLNRNEVYLLLTSLPPFNEQRRIVAKVDQLMSLCDELEARQQKKRESRARLNSAALNRLLAARAPGDFAESWRRIYDNFELLYDAPENVGRLQQVIIQLAVMGKLVEQDKRDESASVLLEQINEEKERIVNEGKIKLTRTSPINNDVAFELPENWEWTRLGNITIKLGAGSTPLGGRSVYEKTGIKFIRSQNVWNDGLRLGDVACISNDIHQKMSGTTVKPGDILLNITGASIGRSAIVPDDFDEGNVSQHVAIVRLVDKKIRHYLHICLISPFIQDSIMGVQVGISREGLSMKNLQDFIIPIPPLEEQRRIVARVDQLMSICDELEAGLMRSQADSERLMEAVVGRMLAGE